MSTIYSAPDEIKKPKIDFANYNRAKTQKDENDYIDKVIEYAKANSEDNCKECGEVISFPVADGAALYVVMSLKPVEIVHLNIGDSWHSEYAELLNAKKIREKIAQRKALAKIFSNNK